MSSDGCVSNWGSIPGETVRRGVSRKGFGTSEVILVMNEIEPDIELAPHKHDGFDQIATIVEGTAVYHVGDVGHAVGPGSLLLIPAGVMHYIEPTGDGPVRNLDVFAPARADYSHLLEWMDVETAAADPDPHAAARQDFLQEPPSQLIIQSNIRKSYET